MLLAPATGVAVIFEEKVLSDISTHVTFDLTRNQLARSIDVMLEVNSALPAPSHRDGSELTEAAERLGVGELGRLPLRGPGCLFVAYSHPGHRVTMRPNSIPPIPWPLRGMTERSDSAAIIASAAEDPAPRSPVKPQAPTTRVAALADHLPTSTTRQGGSVTSWP